jgi:Zn-dependent protease/CBS domain-containing protein
MPNHSVRLGRVFGIEIYVNWSWLIIFVLLTWSLAVFFYPPLYPRWTVATYWIVGAISTVLLFVSVLIHELSHSLVAKAHDIPVRSITLFVFGGVSAIEREPVTARDEFLMAVVGPVSSLVIGGVCFGLFQALSGVAPSPVLGVLFAMAVYNVILGVFNLIPGFPLDGGRVFRSIVWGVTGNYQEATTVATIVGQLFAYLFIFGGLFLALTGSFLSGIWLVFIGWFLNNAAVASRQQAELETMLRGVRVGSVMTPNPPEVPSHTPLTDFVENYVLARNIRALPVVSEPGKRLEGLVTLQEVRSVPRDEWSTTTVDQVMVPAVQLKKATPDEPLTQAVRDMSEADLNQLPVVQDGRLVGMLTRSNIITYLRVREEVNQRAA